MFWKNITPIIPHYSTLQRRNVYAMTSKSTATRLFIQHSVAQADSNRKHQSSALLAICEGNPPVIGGFPSQKASTAAYVSMPCRRHGNGRRYLVPYRDHGGTRSSVPNYHVPFPMCPSTLCPSNRGYIALTWVVSLDINVHQPSSDPRVFINKNLISMICHTENCVCLPLWRCKCTLKWYKL